MNQIIKVLHELVLAVTGKILINIENALCLISKFVRQSFQGYCSSLWFKP